MATFDGVEPTEAQQRAAQTDPRCQFHEEDNFTSRFNGPVVGSYHDFVRLTGLRSQQARRALDGGGMVVFSRRQVSDGVGYLDIHAYDAQQAVTAAKQVEVPATYVDARGKRFIEAFLSPAAAAKAGARTTTAAIVLAYESLPDDNTEERVRAELARIGQDEYFQVERGYRDRYGPGLLALLLGSAVITLGAAGVATGLAQADARADHASLAAVGAPPRVRRALAAWQAGMVAGLGAILGMASGFVPTTAYLYADSEYNLVLPWRNLGLITLIVPAVAALAAWLLTRSRLPLERRLEG
jgi:putative ABC transport system permease protein